MPRHLLEIGDLSRANVELLLAMAADGPQPRALVNRSCLSVFFQESTRTRLGFMSAAARQGAAVLDAGSADQLRREPPADQQLVLAGVADIVVVRHQEATFAGTMAALDRCCVVNAGAGSASHPTQALVDAYALSTALGRDLDGLHVVFLGRLLRSAVSFAQLATVLGIRVSQHAAGAVPAPDCEAAVRGADVIYVQSLSQVDYGAARLNAAPAGPPLPLWAVDAIIASDALVMHALPRGPELPDELAWGTRSLITHQLDCGLPMRSAVLRWLVESL